MPNLLWRFLAVNKLVTALNSKIPTVTGGSYSSTIISGGTVGASIPSLNAFYAKYGNVVIVNIMFWGGAIPGANNDVLGLTLPPGLNASGKIQRYYGNSGYNNTQKPNLYLIINSQSRGDTVYLQSHNATTGAEEAVSGSTMSTKTAQLNIVYITE